MITAEELGQILYEEFRRDEWGSIDPFAFSYLPSEETGDDYGGIDKVMERVAARINEKQSESI